MRPRREDRASALVSGLLAAAVALAAAGAGPSAARAQPAGVAPPAEIAAEAFLVLLNDERQRLGLGPLVLHPLLGRAAQAHADSMTAGRWFGFTSPEGVEIEDFATAAGYRYHLITAKLAAGNRAVTAIVRGWGAGPDAHRRSVFHPEVDQLGVGVGERNGEPLYSLILARSAAAEAAERQAAEVAAASADAAALRERLADLAVVRAAILERSNAERTAAGLSPLRSDRRLDAAAQAQAEELLAGRSPDGSFDRAADLVGHVAHAGYRARSLQLGANLAVGLLEPGPIVQSWLDSPEHHANLLSAFFRDTGLGLAVDPETDEAVWVQILARGR